MSRFFINMSIVMFTLLTNATSFGMIRAIPLKKQIVKKESPVQILSNDNFIIIAAVGDGEVKNKIRATCKYFNKNIVKCNPIFVTLPEFTAHQKDMNSIMLFFSWHTNLPVVNALRKKMPNADTITIGKSGDWSIGRHACHWPSQFKFDYLGQLKIKYSNIDTAFNFIADQLPSEAEVALLFAALSNDVAAVEIIAPKVKAMYASLDCVMSKIELHEDLLYKLINNDFEQAFRLIVKCDPHSALNLYIPHDKTGDYEKPFLDHLKMRNMLPEKIDKYGAIYRELGGRTLDELEPKQNCIIS